MIHTKYSFILAVAACGWLSAAPMHAQPDAPNREGAPFFGAGGPGRGRGGIVREKTPVLKQFDKDGDGRLNATERKAARAYLQKEKAEGRGRRGFGPPGGGRFGEEME